MDMVNRIQIMTKAVSISHSANAIGKYMNPTILYPAMDKQNDRLQSLTLVWHSV